MTGDPQRGGSIARLRERVAFATAARLPRMLPTAALEHRGARVTIPFSDGRGREHRQITEPHLMPAMRAAMQARGGTFVDVGAYTGQTLIKVLLIEPTRRYLGFEPQPRPAAYVAKLLEVNDCDGRVVCAALGDRNGPVELLVAGEFDDAASALGGFRPPEHYAGGRIAAMLRGDEALASSGEVGVLKIDAEGSELDVLDGFAEAIVRDRPLIFCEVLPTSGPGSKVGELRRRRAQDLETAFADAGYRVFGIAGDGELRPQVRPGADPPAPRDFVCAPAGEAEQFAAAVSRFRQSALG